MIAQRILELVEVNAVAQRAFPMSVHVLHVAVEAAELGEELGLVQEAIAVFNVGLDAGILVEPTISVVLCLVDCFSEEVIVLQKLVNLLLPRIFLILSVNYDVHWILLLYFLIVLLCKKDDLYAQESGQQSRLVNDSAPHDILKA